MWPLAESRKPDSHGRNCPNRRAPRDAPATPSLPQNVEAEAALLGALMIDNRLVEDVQLQLQAAPFLRAAARPHLRSDPAHDRQEHGRQPGHAAADVRGRRGDEGSRRAGLSRPADRVGRGGHRRARFRRADLRSRAAPRADRGRPRPGRGRARHAARKSPRWPRSSAPRPSSTRSPKRAATKARSRSFGEATKLALEMAETRAQQRRRICRASPPGSTASTPRSAGFTSSDLIDPRRAPGHGQDLARHQHRLRRGAALRRATSRTGSSRPSRRARRSPSSASKCRPTSSPPASSPSNRGSAPKTSAWARSASRSSATSPAPRASCRACRSTSTTRPA